MESQLRDNTYENFRKDIVGKKIVLFGAGKVAGHILNDLDDELHVDYIIDNDFWRWGKEFKGVPICSPAQLQGEDLEQLVVLIGFQDIFLAEEILRGWGVKHYYAYSLFFERLAGRYENISINPTGAVFPKNSI